MLSHVHLVFRSIDGQKPELLIGDFKRFTSKAIVNAIKESPRESRKEFLLNFFLKEGAKTSNVNQYQFWRHDNKPIELWSNFSVFLIPLILILVKLLQILQKESLHWTK